MDNRRIRSFKEHHFSIDDFVIGNVAVSNNILKYDASANSRAVTNPSAFTAEQGKKYIFNLKSSTYLYAVYAFKCLTTDPHTVNFTVTGGTSKDLIDPFVNGVDYTILAPPASWGSAPIEYNSIDENVIIVITFKRVNNARIYNNDLTAIKAALSVDILEE